MTGALVRLTASGMGCPTWPRCTAQSYVTSPEMGIHGAIEFGNRMLGFVVAVVVLLMVLNRIGVYSALPYAVCGIVLWFFLHEAGLHATLAGVILAVLMRRSFLR